MTIRHPFEHWRVCSCCSLCAKKVRKGGWAGLGPPAGPHQNGLMWTGAAGAAADRSQGNHSETDTQLTDIATKRLNRPRGPIQ